jgi:hypothetical protein
MAGYAFADPRHELARQISDHEACAFIDERFHDCIRQRPGMVQDRVMRECFNPLLAQKSGNP